MTDIASPVIPATSPASAAPTRHRWRRHRSTVLIVAALLLAVLVLVLFGNDTTERGAPLDPENPGPGGAQAVARVLADQGVDLTIVRSADELSATTIDADTAIVVTSTNELGTDSIERLRGDAGSASILLVAAPAGVLDGFGVPDFPADLETGDPLAADCTDPLFEGLSIDVDDASGYEGDGCFGDSSGSAYVATEQATLFGASDALTNDQVLRADNAAVALRLLGQQERLVWYVASYDDLSGDDGVDLVSVLPDWIRPGLVMLMLAAVTLVLWRARRLGPLSTEPLPVTIKAIETTRSRGRLYRKAGDRAHAAEALRSAARQRANERLRLGRGVGEGHLIADVARHVGRPEAEVGWLLSASAPAPGSDRDLIHLANALAALEEEVRRS